MTVQHPVYAPQRTGVGASGSSPGNGTVVLGLLGATAAVAAVVYFASRPSTDQEARNAFPLPKRERQRYSTLVAHDLYGRLRSEGYESPDAEAIVRDARRTFAPEIVAMERDAFSPESTTSYVHALLVLDGTIDGDRREASRVIYGERYRGGSSRARR